MYRVPIPASVLLSLAACALAPAASAGVAEDSISTRCGLDPRLRAAASMALREHDSLRSDAIRDAALSAGFPAPAVRAWVARGDESALRASALAWLDAQHPRAAWARCAAVESGDQWAVVMAPRAAEVTPLAARARTGETLRYVFRLPEGAGAHHVFVLDPRGEYAELGAPGATLDVTFRTAGEHVLQLVADTPNGPLPFATWTADIRADGASTGADTSSTNPRELAVPADDELTGAAALLRRINQRRQALGREPLRRDPLLESLARERVALLAARGEVLHALGPGDDPVRRLERAGVRADGVAENVARAPTLSRCDQNLERSPSHHAVRIAVQIDSAGLAVAFARGEVYVVELFALRPRLVSGQ